MSFTTRQPLPIRSIKKSRGHGTDGRLPNGQRRSFQFEFLEERRVLSLTVPALHSFPSATAKLFLDFDGNPAFDWDGQIAHGAGSASTPIPAFSIDADANNFTSTELTTIQNIWTIVAEKFSPFNIDVTTVDPGNRTDGVTVQDIIGGKNSDWYLSAGGVSRLGSFTNPGAVNTVFDWTGDLNWSNPTFATDFAGGNTIPHEAGHSFGLVHERWTVSPPPVGDANYPEYYSGDATRAPIMGNAANGGNESKRGIWWMTNMESGQHSTDPIQDELSVISNAANGFGYRADDHSYGNYVTLSNPDGSISQGTGVIENTSDVDPFRFRAVGTTGTFTIQSTLTATNGGMLRPTGRLIDAATLSPITYGVSIDGTTATLTTTDMVVGHDYYVEVRSIGAYGDVGQYKVFATVSGFASLDGATLNVFGYGNYDNNITISLSGGIYTLTDTFFGGTATQSFAAAQVVVINVTLGGGNDLLNYGAGNLSQMAPAVVSMGGGIDALTVDDSAYASVTSYAIYGTLIERVAGLSSAAQFDSSVESAKLFSGTGFNNVVNVYSTAATTSIKGSNSSIINIGDNGSVQGLLGALSITNPPTHSSLNIDDSADPFAHNSLLTPNGLSALSPVAISWNSNDINGVTISGGSGGNTFRITGAPPLFGGAHNTINAGSANDSVLMEWAVGTFIVNGQGGTNTLAVDDTIGGGNTYVIGNGSISRPGLAISYGNMDLNVSGGTGQNIYNVQSTLAATQVTINGGGAADIVNAGGPGNLLDGVGNLAVNGGPGTILNLNDQSNFFGRPAGQFSLSPLSTTYLVTDNHITRNNVVLATDIVFGGAHVDFYVASISYNNLTALVINSGNTPNVYSVQSTAFSTPTTINAGAAGDVVNVSAPSNLLDGINSLTVNGGTGTTLNLDDQANAIGRIAGQYALNPQNTSYLVTTNHITRNDVVLATDLIFGGSHVDTYVASIGYNNLSALVINGGNTPNVYNVQNTAANTPTTINAGAAADVVNVGAPNNLLDGINSLTVNGDIGTVLNLDDQTNAFGLFAGLFSLTPLNLTYQVSDNNVTRTNTVLATNVVFGGSHIETYTASIGYTNLAALVINGGDTPNIYNVLSTAVGTPTTINTGNTADTINVGDALNRLDGVLGSLTIHGQAGTETLTVHDQGAAVASQYILTSAGMAAVRSGVTASILFNAVENVSLIGGTGDDTFKMQGTPVGSSIALDGGGSFNTLDYTTYPTVAHVNLASGQASGLLGGIHSVHNLIGADPYTLTIPQSLTLAFASSQLSGPLIYGWDLNGDGVFTDAVGPNPTLTWSQLTALGLNNGESTFSIKVRVTNGSNVLIDSATTTLTLVGVTPPPSSTIAARQLFYNQSKFDGNSANANSTDDAAIATDKTPYIPGSGTATIANLSSYTKGINGIMVDISGPHGPITAADFKFRVGNNNSPSLWVNAPAPSTISVRAGAGVGGSDRVEILWANNAIQKQWLEVFVKGNDNLGGNNLNTGLAASDVHFWGNALADSFRGAAVAPNDGATETGSGTAITNTTDELNARNHQVALGALVTNFYDYDRSGAVNAADQLASRGNGNTSITAPKFIVIAASPLAPEGEPDASPAAAADDGAMVSAAVTALSRNSNDRSSFVAGTSSSWFGTTEPRGQHSPIQRETVATIFNQFSTVGTQRSRGSTVPDYDGLVEVVDDELLELLSAGAGRRNRGLS